MRNTVYGLLILWLVFPFLLFGADLRTDPIDMYLIFDGSSAIKKGKDEAVQWFCDSVVDTLLQEGDTLTVWTAGIAAKMVFSETLEGAEQKEAVKDLLRSITLGNSSADYAGALKDATNRQTSQGGRRIAYTLLVSGPARESAASLQKATTQGFLRYSRVEEHPTWRVMVVALNIHQQVQQAVAAFTKK